MVNFEDTVPPRSIHKDVRTGLPGTDQTERERNKCSGAHAASHEADLRTKGHRVSRNIVAFESTS